HAGHRSRRQRRRARSRRARSADVPARARPLARCVDVRPDGGRPAQRGARRVPADPARGGSWCAGSPIAAATAPAAVRLVYLGTPAMAVPPLEALVDAGHEVALVVTGADKRRGRGSTTSPSPVKVAAERLGIPVSHTVDAVLGQDAELGVVVAFG